jgi:membrane protease YdiL (CAAX protease family)
MAAVKISVALIYRATMGTWPAFGHGYGVAIILTAVVAAIFGGPLGEEIGWRGYALPRLAERFGRAQSSVLLGVIWALWHLPVFFIAGMDQSGQALPVYILQVTALSVAMAWLYWHTNGSLLLAVLMHTAINQTKDLVPSTVGGAANPLRFSATPVAWLTVLVLCVAAAFFLRSLRENPERPTRSPACAAG